MRLTDAAQRLTGDTATNYIHLARGTSALLNACSLGLIAASDHGDGAQRRTCRSLVDYWVSNSSPLGQWLNNNHASFSIDSRSLTQSRSSRCHRSAQWLLKLP